jgi:hypothetical protein
MFEKVRSELMRFIQQKKMLIQNQPAKNLMMIVIFSNQIKDLDLDLLVFDQLQTNIQLISKIFFYKIIIYLFH